jgi:hypothetical protein
MRNYAESNRRTSNTSLLNATSTVPAASGYSTTYVVNCLQSENEHPVGLIDW